jgi:ABC-2 type transport system ATP-binding protein
MDGIHVTVLQKVQEHQTLLDISELHVAPEETAAVAGPPGSGKSALLDVLVGQSQPSAGEVLVAGLNPYHDRARLMERTGVLMEDNALYERLSLRDNLAFHCRLRGLSLQRADETLHQLGLSDQAGAPISRLPRSLHRRLAFGRAILHRPKVLLLQEPFAGCDPASITLLSRLIDEQREAGVTVLIFTADANAIAPLCQNIHLLEGGQIVRSYDPQSEKRIDLPFRVPARQEGQVALINPASILYVSAEEGQSLLHTDQGEIGTHFTISELVDRLSRNGFFRAHRSYLVNLQRVKAIIPYTRDSFSIVLTDEAGTEIPLSKSAARELRELLDY